MRQRRIGAERVRWNHNINYHRVVFAAVGGGRQRALDVGCGEGILAWQLRRQVPEVSGIDPDERSIELARAQDPKGRVDYIRADFLTHPFEAESFDAIASVAALHHLEPVAALVRMKELLRPGGVIVIIGLARAELPRDLGWELGAVALNTYRRLTRTVWEHSAPVVWPPPHTYPQIQALAKRVLPGVRFRRHLLWRYSLTWTKPF